MRNYRIAFFTADWNYELVETTLHGLRQFVLDHENVHLCIFDCFGKDLGNAKDNSEYAIFDLPDLTQFDGLLVQGNQIVLKPVREAIADKIRRTGIPAVTIDCPIEGCTMVGIDNQAAQRDIADHVIRAHGARRLVYLTGIMENGCPEGHQRLDGFLEACRANGVDERDIEVVECTWRTSDGIDVGRNWIKQGHALPDAFVCANDEMALGVMEGLGEHGVRVPDDVLVVGFDNVSSAELSSPRLSTVHRDNYRLNYTAMQVLIDCINGKAPDGKVDFAHELVLSESCGCGATGLPGYIRDKYFRQTRFLKNFYTLQDEMAEDMFDAADLMNLMAIVEKNHRIFGCNNVYLCINDYYYDNYDKKQWHQSSEAFGRQMILAACGRSDASAGAQRQYERFPTRDLLPGDMCRDNRFLMFYPLHYNTYSIGYIVMDGISEAAKLNLHKSIFSFLEIAIENVRKKGLLRQLNDVLDSLYVHDALTGLYNRFGYERYGQQSFEGFLERDGGAQVLFVDMDDMKGINDRFGHEIGDAAIRASAQILQSVCGQQAFMMRYGGDEFLVVTSDKNAQLDGAIQRAVQALNNDSQMPFSLGLSIGVVRVKAGDRRTLDACVQAADALMYENKSRRKSGQ